MKQFIDESAVKPEKHEMFHGSKFSKSLGQLIIVGIFIILVLPSVNAVEIKYYGIEDTIRSDMTVENSVIIKFDSPVGHLDYQLGYKIENLTASANFDGIECETIDLETGSLISCDFDGMTKEKNQIELKFETVEGIEKLSGENKFVINYGINLPIQRVFMLIKLPENAILSREIANESFFPRDGSILTDGKHIMVAWERENLTTGDDLQFMVLYVEPLLSTGVQNMLIVLVTVIVLIAMIGLLIYIKGRKEPKVNVIKEDKFSVLTADEKTIVNILKEKSGKAYQKILVRESDFSKAKVSRLVKALKDRNVIDVIPVSGRENEVVLKDVNEESKEEETKEDNNKKD